MPAPLPVSDRPRVRVHAHPHPGLDPLRGPGLYQRPGVAGPPARQGQASAMSATTTRCCASTTWRRPTSSASASPTRPGPGCSTPSPGGSTLCCPAIRAAGYGGYYWVLDQAEIATDVMFATRRDLLGIWPDLVHHAALIWAPRTCWAFWAASSTPRLAAEVVTDTKRRPEGWRVRHRMGAQLGEGLRQGLGPAGRDHHQQSARVPDPAGLHRRQGPARAAVVSDEKGRGRLLAQLPGRHRPPTAATCDALAAAPLKGEGVAALDALCRPRTKAGRTYARFNPLTPPTWPSSEPSWPASTPSTASATATSLAGSTADRPTTSTKPTDDASASRASSSNSAVTDLSPRSHALGSIELRTSAIEY